MHKFGLDPGSSSKIMYTIEGGGGRALGYIRNRKTKEKIIQHRKTAKKFPQNRKLHTKPSKNDTIVPSGVYRANYTNTNFIKVFVNIMDLSETFISFNIF